MTRTGMSGSRNVRYRALPVSWPTRLRLRLAARADRRAGLPLGMSQETTPVLQDLLARHDDACERERARYLADVAPLAVRLGAVEAELVPLHGTLMARATEHARTSVAPTAGELARRSAGEHDLPESLVRQRRQAEHDRRVAVAAAGQDEAQQALDAVLAERARLEASCRQRAEMARSRVLRYGDHTRRQAALYRRALTRGHPDAEVLVNRWQTELCPAPSWVTADAIEPSRDIGVAA
ncbi:hypothetical protein [Modestobacter sp. URMC 112]